MKSWILLALLVSAAISVENFTNVPINTTPRHSSTTPIYEIGSLKANDLVRVHINFPETATTTSAKYKVVVLDASKTPLDPQLGTFGVELDAPVSPQAVTIEGRVPSDGLYYIEVDKTASGVLHVMEITISVNGVTVHQVADLLRSSVLHMIYLISASTITFTSTIGCFCLVQSSQGNRMDYGTAAIATNSDGSLGRTGPTLNANLQPGYYVFQIVSSSNSVGTYSYQSDPFPCPFSPQFQDRYNIFAPCFHQNKKENLHQANALQAHSCGPRQFFQGGCQDVDPSCNTFDPLGGDCTTCKDPSHSPKGKKCQTLSSSVICAPGFTPSGSGCQPLPPNCLSIDSFKRCDICGPCPLKKCPEGQALSPSGQCTSICPSGYQKMEFFCYKLPNNCIRVAPHLACEKCESGFRFSRGRCVPRRLLTQDEDDP